MAFEIGDWKSNKSIQRAYSFMGEFHSSGIVWSWIKPYHITSVSYEQHTFKQEGQYHGPGILKTFPVLDRGEAGAYKLTVNFEEDDNGHVLLFIETCKGRIINDDGIYNKISDMKNMEFWLYIYDNKTLLNTIQFKEVYFQSAEGNEWSYTGDAKTYSVTFAYDNYVIA